MTPDLDALRQRQQARKQVIGARGVLLGDAIDDIDTLLACLDAQQPFVQHTRNCREHLVIGNPDHCTCGLAALLGTGATHG